MSGKFSDKMCNALNEQVKNEYFSAYLYLAMSVCCSEMNLNGAAAWFRKQYEEELSHGDKMYKYMIERGARVKLLQIDEPRFEWESLPEMFNNALGHEKYITSLINNLVSIAYEDKDYATLSFLQWFVSEQVEEEANVEEVIAKLEMAGASKGNLIYIDKELGKRKED
ncbi:MAG: ferritin [Endomicrobia bacterium]|nr:ferritin [Endomicrobiia bacterium]